MYSGDNSIAIAILGSHFDIVLWDRAERQGLERRQLPSLPHWYLYACSSTLASNMMLLESNAHTLGCIHTQHF